MGAKVKPGKVEFSIRESSLGNLILIARDGRIIALDISKEADLIIRKELLTRYPNATRAENSFRMTHMLLDRYLRGQRVEFETEVDLSGESEFTRKILLELRKVPYGQLISYGDLGLKAGFVNAARAVGQACGRNPIPIIIPCHRVIRGDGSIGGFSMGLKIKERLLATEGIKIPKK